MNCYKATLAWRNDVIVAEVKIKKYKKSSVYWYMIYEDGYTSYIMTTN